MRLSAHGLCWTAGGMPILRDISLEVASGEFLGLVGPNGSGKSSLLALLAGLRQPVKGEVRLDGHGLAALARRDLARVLTVVEQQVDTAERVTARQVVELGRTPHRGPFSPWSSEDEAAVEAALAAVGMAGRAGRLWQTLSGGERQRAQIARALAQAPRIMLLDEPTNHLDIGHQLGLLDLVRGQGLTVVAALHDLNHAAMFCDRIAVMREGCLLTLGTPREVLTPALIAEVFEVEAEVRHDGLNGCTICYRPPRDVERPSLRS